MFGLLNSSQIYGLQQEATAQSQAINKTTSPNNKQRRSSSNASDSGKESKFFASLSSMQGSMKSPTNFIEKFIKTELLGGYDTIKNYKNFQHSASSSSASPSSSSANGARHTASGPPEGILTGFNCLQGSYRSNCEGEFYEAVNVCKAPSPAADNEMTIKSSKNLLSAAQAPATLQAYQKLPECGETATPTPSSGASSGEFNSDAAGHTPSVGSSLYKKLSFGRGVKCLDATQTQEVASDNSSSSISTTTTNSSANTSSTSNKSTDLQRTSSASSSSNDCATTRERKKSLGLATTTTTMTTMPSNTPMSNATAATNNNSTTKALTPERAQRRKLMQMISSYEQHNKLLQRELAKEKRRRTEELACVVKSLICFESKLKNDMKSVNQRLAEKDVEICRLVRQNRALRKQLAKAQKAAEQESACDEGVVEDETEAEAELKRNGSNEDDGDDDDEDSACENKALLLEDCLVLEALQCINCRKQFYDIDLKEGCTQTASKDGVRNNDDHTTEHGSSSDDTVSSSFYGARRSVRYTSKRTSGTFRDYMRSRSMNIDDPSLHDQHNSEETTSSISRDDSQASYEKINIYSRTMERMHGVKCAENDRDESVLCGLELTRPGSRASIGSRKSNCSGRESRSSKASDHSISQKITQIEEDDGIFSPTQDDEDFDEDLDALGSLKIVQRRSMEFSEASPKQVYETSTDDWYASASDQEEIVGTTTSSKCYGHGAINPVLECVNQILLQQSMEEPHDDTSSAGNSLEGSASSAGELAQHSNLKTPNQLLATTASLPRRSSLSGRRSSRSDSHSSDGQNSSRNGTLTRKRVHFSTKNSMVHVPRNDDHSDDNDEDVGARDCEGVVKALVATELISNYSSNSSSGATSSSALTQYHTMNNYLTQGVALNQNLQTATPTATHALGADSTPGNMAEHERLDTLNYESIYSNEYEPIGSEHNSSNLYVDMESTAKLAMRVNLPHSAKMPKMPPALPPKPANLLKFKKSLQQLDEMPDENLPQQDCCNASVNSNSALGSEPDYCSISEVGGQCVQIVADIHKPPAESVVADLETNVEEDGDEFGDNDDDDEGLQLEVSTVASDDTCAATHKTDEIEEIFADIPKLPNVAAIIAPKQLNNKYQSDYLVMSPKMETPCSKLQSNAARKLNLNLSVSNEYLAAKSPKSPKLETTPLKLHLNGIGAGNTSQYKRKHVPNILAEINKRMSQPNSPTTPSKLITPNRSILPPATKSSTSSSTSSSSSLLKSLEDSSPNLPLQAEFDWYNLDLEYGKTPLKVNEAHTGSAMLAEIHEDHEGVTGAADEYNLDEEFSLTCETKTEAENAVDKAARNGDDVPEKNAVICEAINFPLYGENSLNLSNSEGNKTKAKQIKKNLANFEKFIEGSGLSTKPLPSKRKIYFAGPFV